MKKLTFSRSQCADSLQHLHRAPKHSIMKYAHKLFLLLVVSSALLACKKENEEVLGVYAVQDAITGPPAMDWYFETYDIEVSKAGLLSKSFYIVNYANKNRSGAQFKVECKIADQAFAILEQEVNGRRIQKTAGYFSNDSIFFDLVYQGEYGEVFFGHCFGVKK